MKKSIGLILSLIFLSGCATYKYHHGKAPYDKGYVVSRDDYTILEYTLGQDNTVPDRKLAKERFNRRRDTVEDYYKRMGFIENHFKSSFWDYFVMMGKLFVGIVKLPVIAVNDYRYEHDPEYKEKVKKLEAQKEADEEQRIKDLKQKLGAYVQKDLEKETSGPQKKLPVKDAQAKKTETQTGEDVKVAAPAAAQKNEAVKEEPAPVLDVKVEQKTQEPAAIKNKEEDMQDQAILEQEQKAKEASLAPAQGASSAQKTATPVVKKQPFWKKLFAPKSTTQGASGAKKAVVPAQKKQSFWNKLFAPKEKKERIPREKKAVVVKGDLTAAISAVPAQGYSPLRVQFSAAKSRSKTGKIVSYEWDFGDGDTAKIKNPVNTYMSTTYGKVGFTVTLTVKDNKGNIASSSTVIEVMTK